MDETKDKRNINIVIASDQRERGNPEKIMNKEKRSYIYILFNKRNGTLYTGVTSNLIKRIYEHKQKIVEGFTKKYLVDKLGYYEIFTKFWIASLRSQ